MSLVQTDSCIGTDDLVPVADASHDELLKLSGRPAWPERSTPAKSSVLPVNVLGVGVSAVNPEIALREIQRWIEYGERHYVCVTGVHGVMESRRHRDLRIVHNRAGMVLPDGMPLVWWLKLTGHVHADRVCGPEFMPLVFDISQQQGWRHFLYGATEDTLDALRARLLDLYPRARIVGTWSPPFRALTPYEDEAVVRRLNESGADIVWVGLSTPKQEHWMAGHRAALEAAVLIGVGAAFDMHAGRIRRAPAFLRRTGFEWTYRLVCEPKRLWRRYMRNNPAFVLLAAAQLTRLARFPLEVSASGATPGASFR